MISLLRTGQSLNAEVVERSISMIRDENQENPSQVLTVDILTSRGKAIRPKTFNQKKYVEAIDNELTFEMQQSGNTLELYYKLPSGGYASGGDLKYSISYFE